MGLKLDYLLGKDITVDVKDRHYHPVKFVHHLSH